MRSPLWLIPALALATLTSAQTGHNPGTTGQPPGTGSTPLEAGNGGSSVEAAIEAIEKWAESLPAERKKEMQERAKRLREKYKNKEIHKGKLPKTEKQYVRATTLPNCIVFIPIPLLPPFFFIRISIHKGDDPSNTIVINEDDFSPGGGGGGPEPKYEGEEALEDCHGIAALAAVLLHELRHTTQTGTTLDGPATVCERKKEHIKIITEEIMILKEIACWMDANDPACANKDLKEFADALAEKIERIKKKIQDCIDANC